MGGLNCQTMARVEEVNGYKFEAGANLVDANLTGATTPFSQFANKTGVADSIHSP